MQGKTSIAKLKEKISQSLQLEKNATVYLFGSYAKGNQNNDSDVDLLVVADKKESAKAIVHQLYKKLSDIEIDYDILGFSKKALIKRSQQNSFLSNILQNGIVLYGKKALK